MTPFAGYGTEALHLGQNSSALISLLGKPKRKSATGTLREHWLYPELFFEAVVSRKSGNLLSLFYKTGSQLVDPSLFQMNEKEIRIKFGTPELAVEGVQVDGFGYVDAYLAYNSGISFFLGRDGSVRKVAISNPRRLPRRKTVRHAPTAHRQLAALANHQPSNRIS